eukprot:3700899-Pleurochrysis_carterae.AAC.3
MYPQRAACTHSKPHVPTASCRSCELGEKARCCAVAGLNGQKRRAVVSSAGKKACTHGTERAP